MSPIKVEFENLSPLPEKQQNDTHGVNLGDMGIVYSDNTGHVLIVRHIKNGEIQDDFQPRVIPEPKTQPLIINKKSGKYEIIENFYLRPGDEPVTKEIRYIKNKRRFKINTTFSKIPN